MDMVQLTVKNSQVWLTLKWLEMSTSGVHRLFEGQGRKEGHFSMCFGFQEGTLAHVFAT